MAAFVQHHLDPPFAGDDVRQDADVTARAIDVEAESMLALHLAWEEVASLEDAADVDPPGPEGPLRQAHRGAVTEQMI